MAGRSHDEERLQLSRDLLRRGIESRVVIHADERPLEALLTHTSNELQQAVAQVKETLPVGYADAFLSVQNKWEACRSIAGVPHRRFQLRVLSNWYPIIEGIQPYGATYDSTSISGRL